MNRGITKKLFKLVKAIVIDLVVTEATEILCDAGKEIAKTRKPGDTSRDDIRRYPKAIKDTAVEWFYKQVVNFRNTVNWFKNFKTEVA